MGYETLGSISNYIQWALGIAIGAITLRVAYICLLYTSELDDLHQRTREGIETARLAGKQIGQLPGRKLNVKKATTAKEIIKLHSREYGGSLRDSEVQKLAGISRNTLYKYKKELREEL